jgi:hypothetical protein
VQDFSEKDYSVRQIADCVRRPHEDMGTVVDRIRGWSDVGLIEVLGSKFPGTGSRRRYGAGAIIDAVILTALTDAGLAAVRVGSPSALVARPWHPPSLKRVKARQQRPDRDPARAGKRLLIIHRRPVWGEWMTIDSVQACETLVIEQFEPRDRA